MTWRAHDLLRISGLGDLAYLGSEPLLSSPNPRSATSENGWATRPAQFSRQNLNVIEGFRYDRMNVDSPKERCPAWVERSLQEAPLVVVRRSKSFDDLIPVGVRGSLRRQRLAAYVAPGSIRSQITPEQLSATRGWPDKARIGEIPGLRVLADLEEKLGDFPLAYGPTGSIGFELASGLPTAISASDLDLLIRAPEPFSIRLAQELIKIFSGNSCRVDAQIETPCGAVALNEYATGQRPFLLRRDGGPVLVDDPWTAKQETGT